MLREILEVMGKGRLDKEFSSWKSLPPLPLSREGRCLSLGHLSEPFPFLSVLPCKSSFFAPSPGDGSE